jgi:hypothetical protein
VNPQGDGSRNRSDDAPNYDVDFTHGKCLGDIDYGAMTFLRNANPNGMVPELHDDADGPWLRLAVAKNAYTASTDGEPDLRDRCELRDGKLKLGTPVSYSFEMRAEAGFPKVDARFVCAQVKAPYYDANGGSPLFALRIERGRYVATIEHLYEDKDVQIVDGAEVSNYLSRYDPTSCAGSARAFDHHVFGNSPRDFKELQIRAVLATDANGLPEHMAEEFLWCTTGVQITPGDPLPDDIFQWRRFTVHMAPTVQKDEDGIVQLFAADPRTGEERLIATARGEFGHVGYPDPATNTGPVPGSAYQYFKIGPYRDKLKIWGCRPAAIHVRNVKRSLWEPGATLRAAAPGASASGGCS